MFTLDAAVRSVLIAARKIDICFRMPVLETAVVAAARSARSRLREVN
jgi:hypothetical protein